MFVSPISCSGMKTPSNLYIYAPNAQVLEDSFWEPHLCKVILNAINEVMFNKLKFCGSADIFTCPENNYIDKVLSTRSGYPSTLSIIYATIAAQLGVHCLPVCFPGHFLLKWLERPYLPGAEAFTFIDVYDRGTFKTLDKLIDLTSGYDRLSESWGEAISPTRVFTTMCWSLVEIGRQQDGDGKGLLNLCNALELLSILTPADTDHKLLLVRVYMHLCVNMARVISLLQEITESDPNATGLVSYLYRSAITTLETQRIKAEARKLKCQPRNGVHGVEFAVGMVMKHKKYKLILLSHSNKFIDPALSFHYVARLQIKKSYKEKINERKSPLIWTPGCTASTHVYELPLSERRGHTRHLCIEEEHLFSSSWFTNFPQSIGDAPVLFSHSGRISLRLVPSRKPEQEVYISRASLRVISCTTPSIAQNWCKHGHAPQKTHRNSPARGIVHFAPPCHRCKTALFRRKTQSQNVLSEGK
ncbi:F-box only protein 21 [Araneus ventricosus]|uniref:F-box only protein 21 n=1 Tax=Araneus ventricosus TaxID=182803 RepID=A0A4Y2GX04_ARAVE|nr:F-box only protein 21 [Araneus ventricosus]